MTTARGTLELKPDFVREDLRELLRAGDGWRLSLFMPLERTGREVRQSPILLKDLRALAASGLDAVGASPSASEGILGAVDGMLRESEVTVIQGDGLALYAAEHQAFAYLLPDRPEAWAGVDRRFRLDPVLPLLFEDGRFYLLVLGLKHVRLFAGDRKALHGIALDGVPDNMRDALLDEDVENFINLHSRPGSPTGRGPAVYHGQGGANGDLKELKKDILEFFHRLDAGLRGRMPDRSRPLLLAGEESLLPLYREANTHPRVLDVSLPARLDGHTGPSDLHALAWPLILREARSERDALLALYRERAATAWTAAGITDVAPLADQGRISHLFVRRGYQARGSYEPGTGRVQVSPFLQAGDEDLVALAETQAILGGGRVHVLDDGEMPEGADIAALCRY